MYEIDFERPIRVHFIGIGGISMSGLAEVLLDKGFSVSGSDMHASALTEGLAAKGCRIFIGQAAENLADGPDLVVYTAAIRPENPELAEAVRLGLPLLTRAELLGQLMQNYRNAVAVAGTHGKTTTTSMVSEILLAGDYDPTISVGGILPSIGGNIRVGGTDYFVAEACEYTNSFLDFFPTVGVILNIEAAHLDFFKDLADIRHSFRLFAEKISPSGTLVLNSAVRDARAFAEGLACRTVFVGTGEDDDFRIRDLELEKGFARFTLTEKASGRSMTIRLSVPGAHNAENAAAAAAAARVLGIPEETVVRGLSNYRGTHRRFEKKGSIGGITIVDDYAHHPDEIRATLATARAVTDGRIVTVFQSHTYTRTRALLEEFAETLSASDVVVVAPIYAAREKDTLGMSAAVIRDRLLARGTEAYAFETFDEVVDFLLKKVVDGDLLITMGAGDVDIIGDKLLGR